MIHLHMFLGIDNIGLSMSGVFTLKDILGMHIFVFGGNEEHKNGAPNVVDVAV